MEDVLIGVGLAVSIEQIQTILGIVILSFQIVLIIVKTGMKIYQKIKDKKYSEIEQDIEDAKKEIEDVTNKNNGKR